MSDHNHGGGIGKYILVVIILAVVTYLEFALTAYSIDWLSRTGKFVALAVMSVFKFFMVIWFFMHLKDDSKTYTGFFTSGMIIAIGTFIALGGLFTVRSVTNAQKNGVEAIAGHEETVEIPKRAFVDTLRVPQPKNQHLALELPEAVTETFNLKAIPGLAFAEPLSATEDSTNATQVQETTSENVQEDSMQNTDPAISESATDTSSATTTDESSSTTEAAASEPVVTTTVAVADWDKALGEQTFMNCLACHQVTGLGVPPAFPPLAGHINELYNVEGGRQYIINVVLYGLQGEMEIVGTKYNGIMTPWGPLLKDEQIAAVLNHELNSWGNDALVKDFTPILPEEVAAERANKLSSQQVYELRGKLSLE
jgi:mono/diheme cytochrome c family protein/heme/copper-type cytochrome/quinol oxidase subunit 4